MKGIAMKHWPHAPLHRFDEKGTYMVTGATLHKVHFLKKEKEIEMLHDLLLELAEYYSWKLEAWAVFVNHHHFIAISPETPENLEKFITHLHSASARELNSLHGTPRRKIWHQFWDTQLTYRASYLASTL